MSHFVEVSNLGTLPTIVSAVLTIESVAYVGCVDVMGGELSV